MYCYNTSVDQGASLQWSKGKHTCQVFVSGLTQRRHFVAPKGNLVAWTIEQRDQLSAVGRS